MFRHLIIFNYVRRQPTIDLTDYRTIYAIKRASSTYNLQSEYNNKD